MTTQTGLPVDVSAAYDAAIAAWNRRPLQTGDTIEIHSDAYYDALGALPPIHGAYDAQRPGQFWVGEPYTHDSTGAEWSLECWTSGYDPTALAVRYFCRMSRVECSKHSAQAGLS